MPGYNNVTNRGVSIEERRAQAAQDERNRKIAASVPTKASPRTLQRRQQEVADRTRDLLEREHVVRSNAGEDLPPMEYFVEQRFEELEADANRAAREKLHPINRNDARATAGQIPKRVDAIEREMFSDAKRDDPDLTHDQFLQNLSDGIYGDVAELVAARDPEVLQAMGALEGRRAGMRPDIMTHIARLHPELGSALLKGGLTREESWAAQQAVNDSLDDPSPEIGAARVVRAALKVRPEILRDMVSSDFDKARAMAKKFASMPEVPEIDHGPVDAADARRRAVAAMSVHDLEAEMARIKVQPRDPSKPLVTTAVNSADENEQRTPASEMSIEELDAKVRDYRDHRGPE